METESMRSGRSERSDVRSERSGRSHRHMRPSSGYGPNSRHGRRSRHSDAPNPDKKPEGVMIGGPGLSEPMDGSPPGGGERIEVQILPQDDNWGETTTAITGATSETGFSMEDMSRIHKDLEDSLGFHCARYAGSILAGILGAAAFLSPIAMVVLPKLGVRSDWEQKPCLPDCEGLLISFAFKLLILLIGSWALFFRRPKATMPRIFIFRALILFLLFLLTFAFWLFYGVRIYDQAVDDYKSIVAFAVSFVDALLFVHYLAIILLEVRQLQGQYVVKLVRSPDGEARSYRVGQLSIQRMAVWCLEQYYKDFQAYNPYLEHLPRKAPKITGFKFYDVDGAQPGGGGGGQSSRALLAAAARRRDAGHNDRFYEEQEYERRVHKRRARLLVAAEESFTHIKRLQEEQGPAIPLAPKEAAQAIFPSLARALQKYLRITRQQPRYTMDGILEHLATCLAHDASPKAFLERYLTQGAVIWNDKDHRPTQKWVLVCDQLLSREVEDGTLFQLRQGDVSLMASVRKLPHFNVTEDVIDPKTNKFVLRLNSETSV